MVSRWCTNQEIYLGANYKIKISKHLGSGAFGDIYKGYNVKLNEEVAIKMESIKKGNRPLLRYEASVLRYLQGGVGIPIVYDYLPTQDYNFMVMELLGLSLEALFELCDHKFTLKTIIILADQMVSRVEFLHSRHIVHRDIKPDNFLIGKDKKQNQIYIIDFGLAKRFRDPKTGWHIPYIDGKSWTGTVRYASIYTHLGIEQSRRDDLESLLYSLAYFCNGSLPWQGIRAKSKKEKYQKILEKKINTKPKDICKDWPEEFVTFLQYVRNLQFEEKPNYAYLKELLGKIYDKKNYDIDMICDWADSRSSKENTEKSSSRSYKGKNKISKWSNHKKDDVYENERKKTGTNSGGDWAKVKKVEEKKTIRMMIKIIEGIIVKYVKYRVIIITTIEVITVENVQHPILLIYVIEVCQLSWIYITVTRCFNMGYTYYS